jgi:hypothetical protein
MSILEIIKNSKAAAKILDGIGFWLLLSFFTMLGASGLYEVSNLLNKREPIRIEGPIATTTFSAIDSSKPIVTPKKKRGTIKKYEKNLPLKT